MSIQVRSHTSLVTSATYSLRTGSRHAFDVLSTCLRVRPARARHASLRRGFRSGFRPATLTEFGYNCVCRSFGVEWCQSSAASVYTAWWSWWDPHRPIRYHPRSVCTPEMLLICTDSEPATQPLTELSAGSDERTPRARTSPFSNCSVILSTSSNVSDIKTGLYLSGVNGGSLHKMARHPKMISGVFNSSKSLKFLLQYSTSIF